MSNKQSSLSIWNFFQKIIDFIFPSVHKKISGKLFVSQIGSLEFELPCYPNHICVYFEDRQVEVPCDPGSADWLNWRIIYVDSHYVLVIEWDVNSLREITWKIC